MVESLNKVSDVITNAVLLASFPKYGQIMVGDHAFEFYKTDNVEDHLSIEWQDVSRFEVEVRRQKVGRYFTVVLTNQRKIRFSANETGKLMKVVRDRIGDEKVIKASTFTGSIKFLLAKFRRK